MARSWILASQSPHVSAVSYVRIACTIDVLPSSMPRKRRSAAVPPHLHESTAAPDLIREDARLEHPDLLRGRQPKRGRLPLSIIPGILGTNAVDSGGLSPPQELIENH